MSEHAELSVISAVLLDPGLMDDACANLAPEDFTDLRVLVWGGMLKAHGLGLPLDLPVLREHIPSYVQTDVIAGLGEYAASTLGVVHHVELVTAAAQRRELKAAAVAIASLCDDGLESGDLLDRAESLILEVGKRRERSKGPVSIQESVRVALDKIELAVNRASAGTLTGISTGLKELDHMTGGLQPGELIVIAARPSMGKAQPLTSGVVMAGGYTKAMGNIHIGDQLASIDGAPSSVVGVFDQGVRPIYRVVLEDGRSVRADAEHLWTIKSCKWKENRTVTTIELKRLLGRVRYRGRITLAQHDGSSGESTDMFTLSPWLVGMLIGDGCLTKGASFSNPEEYIVLRANEEGGMPIHSSDGVNWRITYGHGQPNPVRDSLGEIGLLGKHSWEKFIPREYFFFDKKSRQALLGGLVETDGWIEKKGAVQYSTSSKRLADDIQRLVWSLGGTVYRRVRKEPKYTYKGETRIGRPAHMLTIALDDWSFIRSPRILKNLRPRKKNTCSPCVVSVEPDGQEEARCILVSHPSRLYLTDNYVVTHNTALCMNIAETAARAGKRVVVFSLEMTHDALAQRMIASLAGVDSTSIRRGYVSIAEHRKLIDAGGEIEVLPISIDDSIARPSEIKARSRRLFAKGGLDLVIVDYLQLIRPDGRRDRKDLEIADASGALKSLAKELAVPVIALSQLNRGPEQRDPDKRRPLMGDLRESGAIEQDADLIGFIFRPCVYDSSKDAREAELIIAKQRNGPTGTVNLYFDNRLARFSNKPEVIVKDFAEWEREGSF